MSQADCGTPPIAPTPIHARLALLAGDWSGTTTVWFEPGVVGDVSPVVGSIRSVLGGRFVVWDYAGSLGGKALAGVLTLGWHVDRRRYEASWIDSFHNGSAIMSCVGAADDSAISVLGHYGPEGGEWGWRTSLEFADTADTLIIRAWNIAPGEPEALALESRLQRS